MKKIVEHIVDKIMKKIIEKIVNNKIKKTEESRIQTFILQEVIEQK
jgi:hypothetical protein